MHALRITLANEWYNFRIQQPVFILSRPLTTKYSLPPCWRYTICFENCVALLRRPPSAVSNSTLSASAYVPVADGHSGLANSRLDDGNGAFIGTRPILLSHPGWTYRLKLHRQDGGGSGSGSGSVAVVAVAVAQSLEGRGRGVR